MTEHFMPLRYFRPHVHHQIHASFIQHICILLSIYVIITYNIGFFFIPLYIKIEYLFFKNLWTDLFLLISCSSPYMALWTDAHKTTQKPRYPCSPPTQTPAHLHPSSTLLVGLSWPWCRQPPLHLSVPCDRIMHFCTTIIWINTKLVSIKQPLSTVGFPLLIIIREA